MAVARDLVDALECVLSVYFSNVRHRNRAAFLLCDELVEMTCKAKMRQTHPSAGRISFPQLLQHPTVGLNPAIAGLGATLFANHETRNQMQHAVTAATVDDQHCADAILDAVQALDHCFAGASAALPGGIRISLRVVTLLSSRGDTRRRHDFEEAMRAYKWNAPFKAAKGNDLPIPVGSRAHWGFVLTSNNVIIAGILDTVGAP